MVSAIQYVAPSFMLILDDCIHSTTPIKTMALTSWAKRSPSNTSVVAFVLILGIAFNLYYRDRPSANNVSDNGSAIAEVNASSKVKAFLKMIRWAEGTDGKDGYRMMFTGAKFDNGFADHPRQIMCTEDKSLCSDAAMAFQFLSTTWDTKANKFKFKDASPKNQYIAAIDLLNDVGAIALIEKDDIAGAIAASSPIWASLPKYNGDLKGVYNQSVKPMPALLQRYKEALEASK
jgi:muramidase (phage lysozyme)